MSRNVSPPSGDRSAGGGLGPQNPPYDDDGAFRELQELIGGRRPPIVLIGAGASVKSGYPTWPELLGSLRDAAGRAGRAQWKRNLDDLSDAPWTAEVFCRTMSPGRFAGLIQRQFGAPKTVREPHLSLARMPFPHFITTNFDPCIEVALRGIPTEYRAVRWRERAEVSEFLIRLSDPQAPRTVLYLHGRYDDPADDIILTETSYVSRYVLNENARRTLMAIFMTHPVLFVGFSMNDPDLANIMREVTARLQSRKPCHYAIMSYKTAVDREATRARMEGKFGVRPVFFSRITGSPDGDDYANMTLLLDALAGRVLRDRTGDDGASQSPEFDPEDPHKGRFGGKAEANGRRVSCRRVGGSKADEVLALEVRVEPFQSDKPIEGRVNFYLHPTFEPSAETIVAKDGRAALDIESFGAFTLGVEIVEERLRLEIDLAELPHLPIWFRRR